MAALMRPNTKVVYTESPGSHTFEVQDVPAIARAAHAGGAKVFMDNTWGIHHFQPFQHGVDVSIQAATKYLAGHSDVLIGSITVNKEADWLQLHAGARQLGQYASPDDCWLALRGIRTMGVRLAAQQDAAMQVAHWLRKRPEVAQVLHPGLPGAPGHDLWRRDFTGGCGLFSFVLKGGTSAARDALIDALALFGIGFSWGGFESLATPVDPAPIRTASAWPLPGLDAGDRFGVRLSIGLEDVADLIADLEGALRVWSVAA